MQLLLISVALAAVTCHQVGYIFAQYGPEGVILTTKATTTTQKPTPNKVTKTTTEVTPINEVTTAIPTELMTSTKTIPTEKTKRKKGKRKTGIGKEKKKKVKDAKKKLKEAKKQDRKKRKETRKKERIALKRAKSELKELKKSMKRKLKLTDRSYMKSFLRNCTLLFKAIKRERKERKAKRWRDKTFSGKDTTMEEAPPNGFEIVKTMNEFANSLAVQLEGQRKRKRRRKEILPISSEGIEMEVSVLNTKEFQGYKFPDPKSNLNVVDSIELPNSIFKSTASKDNATIISIVYDAFYQMTMDSEENTSTNLPYVNSKVLSTTIDPKPTQSLQDPVEIVLTHLLKPNSSKPECVFWKVNESNHDFSRWSSEGCKVHASNQTHTVCHCNHLTDFAVLFRVTDTKKTSEEHRQALTVVSLVGCLISSVCLMITIVVFIVLRKLLRSTRNLIHFNLSVTLLVANILLMLSGKAVNDRNVCVSVSLCLFYFFLSAFFWMLSEGIFIWIMVARAFSENLKAWMYLCIGWGLSFIIVAVSFGVLQYDLIATEFCWLSVKKGAIWAFAGPVLFVIVVNFGILIKVLCTAVEHQSGDGSLKVSARLTLLLLPILGLTWIFGLFAMNEDTVAFEYLFTFFNSCQGVFIFVCYIALNAEVKSEYQKWRAKRDYSQSIIQMKSTSSTSATLLDRKSRQGTMNETTQMIS
eukprot:gene6757-7517_t